MQELLSLYYQCCYQGHWRELNEVLKYSLTRPSQQTLLQKCVKGGHQYCIANASISQAVINLQNAGILTKKYADFEALYDDVRKIIGNISGIGDLTIYDTALRIGFIMFPIVLPQNYVYLARGAMRGAKKILGTNKLKYREQASVFSPYFGNLSSHFVEDFLCIMEDFLCKGGVVAGKPLPPAICQCNCATELRGQQPVSSSQNCSCFCSRLSNEKGEYKEEYIDNGEQINN